MGSTRLRQSSLEERYRKCLRISLTFLFSQVGLMALVVAYSAAGAVLFEWLEADQEIEPRRKILQIRLDCLERLSQLNYYSTGTSTANSTELWAIKAGALLKAFETEVVKATKLEGYDGKEVDDAERQWSVSGALLYSITVITTIGYGNLAPKTGPGKVVTIIYALIGIPLMLLCLSNLGTFMASSFQFAFGKLYCCLWCSSRHCCCNQRRQQRRREHHQEQLKTLTQPGVVLSTLTPVYRATAVPPTTATQVEKKERKMDDGLSAQDLAELAERDYDIVIEEDRTADGVVRTMSAGLNYSASDKLNDKARFLLADCSRYDCRASNNNNVAGTPVHISDWPTSDAQSGGQADEGHLDRMMGDSPPPAVCSDTKLLGNVPADETSKLNPTVVNKSGGGQQRVPVSVVLAFLVGYICIGAAVFSAWEEWSYLDGAYFSFITLSTIGFGDLVPGSKVLEQGQTKLVACIVYLVVGLAMIAMSFNLVQEEVVYNFQKLGQNMGILDEK
ncbi:TWiK family of potassium channels protein 7-like [Daphnia carinata]|uniref:TWiK family of potassium channels protein 7-like n=1 Tax=Daphnia carinata TaxID=120202 RepID=UPI002579B55D|nr:TWiK family of potassium channels protein 7-like [Daphnia carinata]